MKNNPTRVFSATATGAASLLIAAGATAQPCSPAWDVTAGNPGISGGYAGPMRAWNDGSGEKLFIGGSFTAAAGVATNGYIARWNPANGTWSSLGSGINQGFTGAYVSCITPFNPGDGERLVVGGQWYDAGGVAETASLAMWNGSMWQAMNTTWTGTTRGVIWSSAVWNGRLFVGGSPLNNPPTIGGQPWAGFASWDGHGWTPHITSMSGSTTPAVFALQIFNDGSGEALYAAGRFTGIDGIPGTGLIARWNGTSWSSVGGGLFSTVSFFGLEGMCVFNDGSGAALYVSGYPFNRTGLPTCSVAKWNGTAWSAVGGPIGTSRITCVRPFDDGSGPKLYIGGTAAPQINYIARWESNAWTPVGGGITGGAIPPSNFPSVFGLNEWQGKLYVAGDFTQLNNSQSTAGLAAWTSCSGTTCYPNCDASTVAPVLNVNDFQCFINKFAAEESYANCDHSTVAPVLNVNDFQCFVNAFAVGCR